MRFKTTCGAATEQTELRVGIKQTRVPRFSGSIREIDFSNSTMTLGLGLLDTYVPMRFMRTYYYCTVTRGHARLFFSIL